MLLHFNEQQEAATAQTGVDVLMAARGPKSDKIWSDAVRRAVLRRLENVEGKPQKIERLADKVVDMALDGDIAAVKEVADRLDGKPAQQQILTGDKDSPIELKVTIGG